VTSFVDFQNFQKKLNDWCSSIPCHLLINKDQLEVNQDVCVQTQEIFLTKNVTIWHRAKVTKTDPVTEVYMIDVGKSLLCSPDMVLDELPEFYHLMEPRAKKCCLRNAKPKYDCLWSAEAIKYFEKLMNDCKLSVTYVERYQANENCIDDKYTIEVFNENR